MKKFIIALLTGCLMVSLVAFPAAALEERPWMIGDPSWDGTINSQDALVILRKSLQLLDCSDEDVSTMEDEVHEKKPSFHRRMEVYDYHRTRLCGDVNNDDKLTAEDALMLLQYAVGKRDGFTRTDFTSTHWRVQRYPAND